MVLSKPFVRRPFFSQQRSHNCHGFLYRERELRKHFECRRTCNAKAAAIVGDVFAVRVKVEGLPQIHPNIQKELDKGLKNRTKIWALINSLRSNGVNLIDDAGP